MNFDQITDWDAAYENRTNIPNGDGFIATWEQAAADFRASHKGELDISYGATDRSVYDLFLPKGDPKGLFAFVHGGYWVAFDKSIWSHFAAGPLAAGWAVAMPSYDLCPNVTIPRIEQSVGQAITHAASRIDGPIVLSGHSAGGHLVSRMMCADTPLAGDVADRLRHVMSISGVHDLRPMLRTSRNSDLRLTEATAHSSSPALGMPLPHVRLTAWVGGTERQEFLRQNALLANIWRGLGIKTTEVTEPDRHHFNVIDGLMDVNSDMCRIALADT
ncbi:alpha/beta hydrolase [Parasulfitobacter algicola]|uniref:Alpha/beta hydrolase n=1 Tax=Parasulfitobacter algicola TaxID=2614809 RepID=A0ABX2IZQ9_9RHOB|nr:alpha/beta hydrolase [Sulfitobacter algicola]NSX56271.1 alpha/beta hydrolase [Sulfitobacter algicola]